MYEMKYTTYLCPSLVVAYNWQEYVFSIFHTLPDSLLAQYAMYREKPPKYLSIWDISYLTLNSASWVEDWEITWFISQSDLLMRTILDSTVFNLAEENSENS